MKHVLVMGAGKIGSLIAYLLSQSQRYHVHLADIQKENPLSVKYKTFPQLDYHIADVNDNQVLSGLIKKYDICALISSLPYYANLAVAKIASEHRLPYFDLTEDIKTTQAIETFSTSSKSTFVPQCGLAPGFISIIAHHLMQHFQILDTVKMRVGALPLNTSNALQYALTWSTEGLINEYGNPCHAIENGKTVILPPLESLETISIDGLRYEAFNTSGGLGSLAQTYQGKIKHLSYKTIRYPGHCEKMKFLMNDLRLNQDRDSLKHILERVIPRTEKDIVLVYVSVTGMKAGEFLEENYVQKFYPAKLNDVMWSAIQLTTASSACVVMDLVLQHPQTYHGFVRQEQFSYDAFINNLFGQYFNK